MPMGRTPLVKKGFLGRRGIKLLAREVTSAELSTDHKTHCFSVCWGRGSCPRLQITKVTYSASVTLVRSPFLRSIPVSCSGRPAWRGSPGSVSDIKNQESHVTTKLVHWWTKTGATPINLEANRSIEIDQTVQSCIPDGKLYFKVFS